MIRIVCKQFWIFHCGLLWVMYFFFLLHACRGVQVKSFMRFNPPKNPNYRSGNKNWRSALPHASFTKIPRSKHFYFFLYLRVMWGLSRCAISHTWIIFLEPKLHHCLLSTSFPTLQKPPLPRLVDLGRGLGCWQEEIIITLVLEVVIISKFVTFIK